MRRYDQYGQLDDQPKPLGDRRFIGLNMRLDPSQLPEGWVSEAINMRFRNGVAESRLGYTVLPWLNKLVTTVYMAQAPITRTGSTATFSVDGAVPLAVNSIAMITGATQPEYNGAKIVTGVTPGLDTTFTFTVSGSPVSPGTGTPVVSITTLHPWGEVHGVGVFSDPFTFQEYVVIAADGGVYYTQPGNAPQAMTLPPGVTITGTVEFTQAFNVLLMHRGTDEPTLMLPRITEAWQLVEQTVSGDGTETIPNATHSIFLQNRLFIPNDKDEIAVSDLNDYTRYVPVLQEFKVNQGSADEMVGIFKFNDTTIIALKEHSIYALGNVYGNLAALQMDELTSEFGCVARKSIAHVGKDLWFLSELGVMSITQTEQNKLQGVVLPTSDPIQPLIDRINWRYADGAVASYADNKYYLAVPLDDAELIGIELAPVGWFRTATGGVYKVATVAGHTYRWIQVLGTQLVNGTETITASSDFVAQGSSVSITHPVATVTDSLKEVIAKGVNNATLVYDLLNGAWSGYDESPGLAVHLLSKFTYEGRQRLFTVSLAGYIMLNEENFEDQLPVPYTELALVTAPVESDQFQVNAGTVVTAFLSSANAAAGLGISAPLAIVQNNLWADTTGEYGYYFGVDVVRWQAPHTAVVKIPEGVRFYGLDGVVPVVTLNVDNTAAWVVTEINEQPIITRLVTRGYTSDVLALSDYEWLVTDVQTWAPQTSIDVSSSGVNEVQAIIEDRTRDRRAYYEPGDSAGFELDNDNGDFLTPYRQDYSLLLGGGALAGVTPDFAVHATPDGVPLSLHQESRITERVNVTGRSVQVAFANEMGRMRVMAVALELNEDNFSAGTKA